MVIAQIRYERRKCRGRKTKTLKQSLFYGFPRVGTQNHSSSIVTYQIHLQLKPIAIELTISMVLLRFLMWRDIHLKFRY